jgi:hypothetical protein
MIYNPVIKTIHSISGGKTSSYMALHYPADYIIFSLVKIDDKNCKPKDEILIKYVSDKINEEFIATAESDLTLIALMELEQQLGKNIIWVSGLSFDRIIDTKGGFLPSYARRFCTIEMKIRPIFDWWYANIGEKVRMGIGYRYDELERMERFSTSFKGIVGKRKTQNKWDIVEWRDGYFPLIEDKVHHIDIIKWADRSGINFPLDSNCVGCFHKNAQQLRKNWDENVNKMQWFADKEKIGKGTFKEDGTYEEFKKIGLQLDFNYGGGVGCNGGFCTD